MLCIILYFIILFLIKTFDFLDDWHSNIQWPNGSNGLTSSQSMGFNDVKPWSADFSNPFNV